MAIRFLDEERDEEQAEQQQASGLQVMTAGPYGPVAQPDERGTTGTGVLAAAGREALGDLSDMVRPTEMGHNGEQPWVLRHPVLHFLYEGTLGNADRMQRGVLGAVEQAQVAAGGMDEEQLAARQAERGDEQLGYVGPLAGFGGGMLGQTRTTYRDILRNAGVEFSEDEDPDKAYEKWYSEAGLLQLGREFAAAAGHFGSSSEVVFGAVHGRQVARAAQKKLASSFDDAGREIFETGLKLGLKPENARGIADDVMMRYLKEATAAGRAVKMKPGRGGRMVPDWKPGRIYPDGPKRGGLPTPEQVRAFGKRAAQKLADAAPRGASGLVDDAGQAAAQGAAAAAASGGGSGTAAGRQAAQLLEQAAGAGDDLIAGAYTVVHGARGVEIPAQYVAMPRRLMQGSQAGPDMARNPAYPLANTRDYSQQGEREKALAVRNGFLPVRHVTDATDAAVGPVMVATIVQPDGTEVETRLGGNTRGWAIEQMPEEKRGELMMLTNQRAGRFGLERELPDPDYELVRHLGRFDLREPGERERVQQIVDALNPAPGKVQNAAEMAAVDASTNLPAEAFDGVDMQVAPADAQDWVARQVAAGHLDANLRGQIAEKPAAAQDYVRRAVATRAFGTEQAPVVEFLQQQDAPARVMRGMLEQAAPVLVRMRAQGMDELADAVARSAGTIVADYARNGNMQAALEQAARQQEMDPRMAVVNSVARALAQSIATTPTGRVQAEDTLAATQGLWLRVGDAVAHYSAEPDLFGEMRQPHEVVAEAVRRAGQPDPGRAVEEERVAWGTGTELRSAEQEIAEDFPGVQISLMRGQPLDGYRSVEVSRIVVPPDSRGQGVGTAVMQRLAARADRTGTVLAVDPSLDFGASSLPRLRRFYERNGFVANKGSNAMPELSAAMYRLPRAERGSSATFDYAPSPDGRGMVNRNQVRAVLQQSGVQAGDLQAATADEMRRLQTIAAARARGASYAREQLELLPGAGSVQAPPPQPPPAAEPVVPASYNDEANRASRALYSMKAAIEGRDIPSHHVRQAFDRGETVSSLVASRYRTSQGSPLSVGMRWNIRGAIIEGPADIMALAMPLRSPHQESFKVAYLDAKNRVIDARIVSVGRLDRSIVHAREAFGPAPAGTASVAFSHNHPSGNPQPSGADYEATRTLNDAARLLGYNVYDHVITDHGTFWSFRENGNIELTEGLTKPKVPRGMKQAQYRVDRNVGTHAPWEAVPRGELPKVSDPDALRRVGALLRDAGGGEHAHIVMLTAKNQITAVSRVAVQDRDPSEVVADVMRRVLEHGGAASFVMDWPGEEVAAETLRIGRQLQAAGATIDVEMLDLVTAGGSSLMENGLLAAEKRAAYTAGQVAEARAVYGRVPKKHRQRLRDAAAAPFASTGLPDPEMPLAVRGGVQPSHWEQQRLGGLELVRPIEMPELVRIATGLGARFRTASLRGGKQGHFKHSPATGLEIALDQRIFRDPRVAAQVMAHELGHLVDYFPDETLKRGNLLGHVASLRKFLKGRFGEHSVTDKELREELMALTQWWRPYDLDAVSRTYADYRKSATELYADALSVMLVAPAELKARAPKFWHQWIKHLERKPEVAEAFIRTWEMLQRPEAEKIALRREDIREAFKNGEEIILRKAEERRLQHKSWRGWADRFEMQYYDVYSPAKRAATRLEKQGGSVDPASDPRVLFEELPFADNAVYRLMQRTWDKVVRPLEERGITMDQLGEYMLLNRIANEQFTRQDGTQGGRAVLANPHGHNPDTARRQLLDMRLALGMDSMQALQDGARAFHDLVFGAVTEGVKAGTINRELYESVLKPNRYNYATFATLEHLENDGTIAAGIREQVGTLKAVANPFVATLLKSALLVRWNQFNQAKAGLVKVLSDLGETSPARMAGDSPAKPPQGRENFMVMADGTPQFWVVDPIIAEMMRGVSPAHANAAIRLLNFGFKDVVYPLLITYNPGFAAKNIVRDFQRTARNLPAAAGRHPVVAGGKLAVAYGRAWKDAVARARGEMTPLLAEMIDNMAIGNPADTFVRNEQRHDVFGDIMRRYGVFPEERGDLVGKYLSPVRSALDGIAKLNAIIETLPKVAAYRMMREHLGLDPRSAAHEVRNNLGTPNFAKRGQQAAVMGAVRPFVNVCIRGLEADAKKLFDWREGGAARKDNGAALIRWALGSGLLVLAKVAAEKGYFGEDVQNMMQGVSSYTKTNYHVIPVGTVPGGDFGNKVLTMRIPMDETERALNAAMYSMLAGDARTWDRLTGIMDVGTGIFPGWNINATVASKWSDFVAGDNPRDDFRGRPILPNDVYLRGGTEAAGHMLAWTAGKAGALNIVRVDRDAETWTEGVINSTPFINSLLTVTDYGYREQQMDEERMEATMRAELRAELPRDVIAARRRYWQLQRIGNRTEQQEDAYRELRAWYRRVYAPADEEARRLADDNDMDAARRVMRTIQSP